MKRNARSRPLQPGAAVPHESPVAAVPPKMFARMLATVRRIPSGKVSTYGDVAYASGFPGAARQVAWALHASKGLPWHRVVGAGGRILLTGEAAFEQRFRLEKEGILFRGLRIDMTRHRHVWRFRKPAKRRK